MINIEPIRPFSFDEAAPVLRAFSKLGPVKVVNANPFFRTHWPFICWVDAPEFHPEKNLLRILWKYPGRGSWDLFSDQPRLCLGVSPDSLRGESPFVIREAERPRFQPEFEIIMKRVDQSGQPVPWRDRPFVDPEQFRSEKVAEMARLGAYLEDELDVQGKPSLGLEFSNESLELPLIEDRAELGGDGPGGVLLVSDVQKFAENSTFTAPHDRVIHFWLTDSEALALCSEISTLGASAGGNEPRDSWALLEQVAGAQLDYGGLLLSPEKVLQVATEAADLESKLATATARGALEKIQSICRSARNYGFGMSISGIHEG